MSNTGSLIPISDEQAKAIQEALKTLQGIGGFLEKTFGTVPQDLVGLLGGDWLKVRRAENIARILEKTKERLKARKVETPHPASLSIALPILVSAADESRDELQDIWARLLAAAADPSRAKSFRIQFIEVVKKMDSLDAAVLQTAQSQCGGRLDTKDRQSIEAILHVSRDEVEVSVSNLHKLELVGGPIDDSTYRFITPFGREFLRTVSG